MKQYVILEANASVTYIDGDYIHTTDDGRIYVYRGKEIVYIGAHGGWWSVEVREIENG